jgi:N-acetylglucosaminyl-diphospho-decaprenol L-rhamnosyltransferase
MTRPLTAISIVSHGQTDLVDALLDDLFKLEPNSLELLVLTLNLVEEGIPANFLKESPWRKVLLRNDYPQGFGANHNAAFKAAFPDRSEDLENWYWVVLNPDIGLPDPRTFLEIRSQFTAGIELVAPAVVENRVIAASARPLYTPTSAVKSLLGFGRTTLKNPDWIAGMFMMLRAKTYRRLGGFDERFFMYCEDVELCLRIQLEGGKLCYLEKVIVEHGAQRASHRSMRAFSIHCSSACKLWLSKSFWRFRWGRLMRKI